MFSLPILCYTDCNEGCKWCYYGPFMHTFCRLNRLYADGNGFYSMFSVKAESRRILHFSIDKVIFSKCSRTITVIGDTTTLQQLPVMCIMWTPSTRFHWSRIPKSFEWNCAVKTDSSENCYVIHPFSYQYFLWNSHHMPMCIRLLFENDFVICEHKHYVQIIVNKMLFVLMPSSLYSWLMTTKSIYVQMTAIGKSINKLNPMKIRKPIISEWKRNRSCFGMKE